MKKELIEQREAEGNANPKPETGAGKPAPKKPLTLKELAVRLAETANTFSNELEARDERLNGHDKDLEDHEKRLAKLELAAEQTASAPAEPETEPTAEPQNESAPQPEPKPQAEQSEPKALPAVVKGTGKNGPGMGYTYWDWQTKTWGITSDVWVAEQLSNGNWKGIWVWYKNGVIDHELSREELAKYTPA